MITFNSQDFLGQIAKNIDNEANVIGKRVVQLAEQYAPKRTGHLASTISYAYDNQSHAISFIVGAEYGLFVDKGTRYMMGSFFLERALNTVGEIYGFETTMEFQNVIQTDKKLLAHGSTYQMHKSLTPSQKEHVRKNLKPAAKHAHYLGSPYHGVLTNVGRAKLKVRHKF